MICRYASFLPRTICALVLLALVLGLHLHLCSLRLAMDNLLTYAPCSFCFLLSCGLRPKNTYAQDKHTSTKAATHALLFCTQSKVLAHNVTHIRAHTCTHLHNARNAQDKHTHTVCSLAHVANTCLRTLQPCACAHFKHVSAHIASACLRTLQTHACAHCKHAPALRGSGSCPSPACPCPQQSRRAGGQTAGPTHPGSHCVRP